MPYNQDASNQQQAKLPLPKAPHRERTQRNKRGTGAHPGHHPQPQRDLTGNAHHP